MKRRSVFKLFGGKAAKYVSVKNQNAAGGCTAREQKNVFLSLKTEPIN